MRIDLVITELDFGGAERCLTELALGLCEAGDDVRVFAFGTLPTDDQSVLVDRMRAAGISVESAECDGLAALPRCFASTRRWFQKRDSEICQTFLFHANFLATQAAVTAGVPIRVGGVRVAERNRIRDTLERRSIPHMRRVVCVSSAVEQFAHRTLRATPTQTVVIPNGVDVPSFATARPIDWSNWGWQGSDRVCLFVGRMNQQKGIDLLQRQVDAIAPAGTNRRLMLVGSGPLERSVDRWVDRIGHDRVRRIPWQPKIERMMAAATMLVLPSRWEGMPNVVLEAMATARPVVCSRVEGIGELIATSAATDRHNQTFDSGDDAAMAAAIDRFFEVPEAAASAGRANQTVARQDFSIPAMVASYRRLYQDLIRSSE